MSERAIGVFDSGVGGLGIALAIKKLLPTENILYLADNANFPYGDKSPAEIRRIACAAAKRLVGADCKLIVVACNTATTVAIGTIREQFKEIPIVGIVPMIKPAVGLTKTGVVAVMMTPATLEAEYYSQLKLDYAPGVRVIDQACPDWVEMVETGQQNFESIKKPLEQALSQGADVVVLGCTHFEFLMSSIKEVVKGRALVVHPAGAVAIQVERVLAERELLAKSGAGNLKLISSGPGEHLKRAVSQLMRL